MLGNVCNHTVIPFKIIDDITFRDAALGSRGHLQFKVSGRPSTNIKFRWVFGTCQARWARQAYNDIKKRQSAVEERG
jgi:hypothetical protein